MDNVKVITNRKGLKHTFTLEDNGDILWEFPTDNYRCGSPNDYQDAYQSYIEDTEAPRVLTLEEFKKEVHEEGSEISKQYEGKVSTNFDIIDMVDPEGGPYMKAGMEIFDRTITEFEPHLKGFIIKTDYFLEPDSEFDDIVAENFWEIMGDDKVDTPVTNVESSNVKEKTINDFIEELQNLKPSLRSLPVKIQTENGLLFEPKAKVLLEKYQTLEDKPNQMIITFDK